MSNLFSDKINCFVIRGLHNLPSKMRKNKFIWVLKRAWLVILYIYTNHKNEQLKTFVGIVYSSENLVWNSNKIAIVEHTNENIVIIARKFNWAQEIHWKTIIVLFKNGKNVIYFQVILYWWLHESRCIC